MEDFIDVMTTINTSYGCESKLIAMAKIDDITIIRSVEQCESQQ